MWPLRGSCLVVWLAWNDLLCLKPEFDMPSADPFSQHYLPLLDNTYDVVDRIVVHAYFALAGTGGGMRYWWQQLHGSTDKLDNTHLMRMAGRFSRRVRGWAKKNDVPVIYCTGSDRKHRIAAEHQPDDPEFCGIFAVLVYRLPVTVWKVLRFESGGFHVKKKDPMPRVYHYAFHIMDPDWGHIVVQISGHPPFRAMVMLNGHEYTECQARKAGLTFSKEGNCFTEVSDGQALAEVADSLRTKSAAGHLREVCDRWIYTCLAFGLSLDEQQRSGFRYSYSIQQLEYSRNLLFQTGHQMEQVFHGVVDRTRSLMDARRVLTIFGSQRRRKRKGSPRRFEAVLESPVYDLTIFKIHFGRLTLKIYTKGERVLRAEAIAHNSVELKVGKVIEKFGDMVSRLTQLLDRFLSNLICMERSWINAREFEQLPQPGFVGQTRVGGIDVNSPRMRVAMHAVLAVANNPRGFTAAEHAAKVRELQPETYGTYTSRQAAYDLKKLRGKGMIEKTGTNSRRYEPTRSGLQMLAGLHVLRDKVLLPLLSNGGRLKPGLPPEATAELDLKYKAIQREMQQLLKHLNFAA